MAVLVTLLAGVVLFTAGARIGHFLTIAVVATPILFGAVASAQYRLARVITFLNPGSAPSEATWQVHQSLDRKSTRLNSSHLVISYAVFCLKKKNKSIGQDVRGGCSTGIAVVYVSALCVCML